MNLVELLAKQVDKQPDHPAILGPKDDQALSYKQLMDRIQTRAQELTSAGLRAGHCVGLHIPSGTEYVILTYAVWQCGASVVPLAMELTPGEKQHICREICLNAILTDPTSSALFSEVGDGAGIPLGAGLELLPTRCMRAQPPQFSTINAAFLRFTSGTTGNAKGVILSHETIYDRISAANEGLRLGPSDRVIWLLSMSYHFAVSIVAYLSYGATFVLCKNHFGGTLVKTAAERKGTLIYGSPVHYELMAHDKSGTLLPELRLAISTAASLDHKTAEAFRARFDKALNEAYGIIEIGLPCINLDAAERKPGSVGRPLPAYELRMQDIGLGENHLAIQIRGQGILDAYYDPWKPRSEIMEDGWFSTGDLGRVDAEGYLYIHGRSKEMINVGGMKFFPQEVEGVLESHPAVKEACVFGHPHERFGEVPFAHIVLANQQDGGVTEEKLKAYCAARMAAFKKPEKIVFVNTLARTASGKVIREPTRLAR